MPSNRFVEKLKFSLLKTVLKIHSRSYKLAGRLAIQLEKDRLHPKHRIMQYHAFFVNNVKNTDFVLDVGCGNGALSYDIAKKARSLVGIDLSEQNIAIARQRYSRPNITHIHGNALWDLPDRTFDVIVLSNVLEHIEKRVDFLSHLGPIAPKLLLRVPMLNRSWIDLYKKELGLDYRLDPGHFTEYTLEDLKKELQLARWSLVNYSVQFGEIWAITCRNDSTILRRDET